LEWWRQQRRQRWLAERKNEAEHQKVKEVLTPLDRAAVAVQRPTDWWASNYSVVWAVDSFDCYCCTNGYGASPSSSFPVHHRQCQRHRCRQCRKMRKKCWKKARRPTRARRTVPQRGEDGGQGHRA
jgi:hypothetical protein